MEHIGIVFLLAIKGLNSTILNLWTYWDHVLDYLISTFFKDKDILWKCAHRSSCNMNSVYSVTSMSFVFWKDVATHWLFWTIFFSLRIL